MKIRLKIPTRYDDVLNRMAVEARCSIDDLCEVAVYNIIALWANEKGFDPDRDITVDAYPGVVPGVERVGHIDPKTL